MMNTPVESNDEFADEELTNPGRRDARARILVVEDDASLRRIIVARMRRDEFDVVEAGTGNEALDVLTAVARGRRPADEVDLIVMDIRMPGVSGLEIARILRDARWAIPIVLITAFPDGDVISEASRLGLSLLAKPFALDRLSDAAIAALLERRGLAAGGRS